MRLLAVALLAASAAPAPAADDPSAAIEVGRFGVMLDQAEAAQKLAMPASDEPAPDLSTGGIYRQPVATVLRYNVIAERVCRGAVLPKADCEGPFTPSWLGLGAVDDPARLRPMIDEAGARIGTFWSDMCEKARSRDEHLCDIE